MNWYVYMLRCEDNSIYTGVTTDVTRRFSEHQDGKGVGAKYTRARKPTKILYTRRFRSRSNAQKEEARIKALTKDEKEHLIAGNSRSGR